MFSVKPLIGAAAALANTTAFAADMPQYPPPPPQPQMTYQAMPMVVQQPMGAWYLRGDIGIGITKQDFVYEQNPLHTPYDILTVNGSMADTVFFGGGVGYEFNNWLRFDATAEYRTKSAVNAFLTYQYNGGVFGDQYQGFLQSVVFLANAYVDLGTWNCLTPFVGIGVGGAWNKFADLVDTSIATPPPNNPQNPYALSGGAGTGIGRNSTNLNFAWALHAGLAYNVTQNFTVEFAYRYLNYGSVTDIIDCAGGCIPDSYKLQNLTSQDFKIGMRWRFPTESQPLLVQQAPVMVQQPAPVYTQPAPVYTQPAPVYTQPAPVYTQPPPVYAPPPQYPLSTRG
jgi:opacity protein-like surface antigen